MNFLNVESLFSKIDNFFDKSFFVINNIVKKIDSIDWNEVRELFEILENQKDILRETNKYMVDNDYPLIDYFSLEFLFYFVDEFEKDLNNVTNEKIVNTIVKYFDEYHIEVLKEKIIFLDLEDNEKAILINVVNGYKDGYYDLVIPTLFSRLEGMVYRSINYKGKTCYPKYRTIINLAFEKVKMYNLGIWSKEEIDKIESIHKKKFLKSFNFGTEKAGEKLSRHSIMHGNNISYGTKENCVKLFLHFEYLYFVLNSLNEDDKMEIRKKVS